MPVIGIHEIFCWNASRTQVGRDDLVERLQHLGCDVEGYATMRRFACGPCGSDGDHRNGEPSAV